MVEKVITLENVSLIDFLGPDNQNIRQLAAAFPGSKIISRGNEIKIQGQTPVIQRINDILSSLIEHYHQFGQVTDKTVSQFIGSSDDELEDARMAAAPDVILFGAKGGIIKARTANQQRLVDAVLKNDLVFALGPAGTGKTYISVALAVRALKNKEVKKIIISRPVVEAGESLGFLPGDMKEKVDPYLRPIYDALEDMLPPEKFKFYLENKTIEIAPLAYMRGRTLNHAFVLLDEAQNTTPSQLKMFLTRMGPNAKVMVNGDQSQVDLPTKQKSGLGEALDILRDVKGIGFVEMTAEDVVRHRLVKEIVYAYDKFDADQKRAQAERPVRPARYYQPGQRPESEDLPTEQLPVNHEQS
ncbi:phosphate starvation-inducible protein PhoH [Hymenobacter busanensis]|uniref:PhoH-like protein n=1 Tax=Hymenobacter busanensis TaxID=2607656 RepID=A0A7L5A2A7_9BACT|nr:PhoH family protein [Hymenobacter busanensis]KAA9339893.1 phosphate starvation-inducible protein PhoH [Hymenobacter busanensis]QHJ09641.1 phosphate starvation-inducible protein PhoH [Hymenobacter busanensis]